MDADERVHRKPEPIWRVAVFWLIAVVVFEFPYAIWLARDGLPGEPRMSGFCVPVIGLVVVLLIADRTQSRPPGSVVPAIVVISIAVGLVPRDIAAWPATIVYVGAATAYLAAYVTIVRIPPYAGPLRALAGWTGLWVPMPLEVAAHTPVPWAKAARTWILTVTASTAGTAFVSRVGVGWWMYVIVVPFLAFLFVARGLLGSFKRPRARHAEAALLLGLPSGPIYVFGLYNGFLSAGSPWWSIGLVVCALTALLGGMVAITHRTERAVPVDGVAGPTGVRPI